MTFNHNASYLLYVAGRVLHGGRMYVDIPEINPPLIIWLNMPVAWVAQYAGLADITVFRLAVVMLALLSIAASGLILRGMLNAHDFWAWIALGIYATIALPAYSFGEREHIALLCVLPYLAEAARRMEHQPCRRSVHIAVALVAALGLALKPHFLLVPLFIESTIVANTRRMPGAGVFAALALLSIYAIAVAWWTPAYFDMLRLLSGAYWSVSDSWLGFLAVPQFMCAALFVTIAWIARTNAPSLARSVSLAALGFAMAAIIQHKGWSYHWLPTLALSWILFGLVVSKALAHRGAAAPFIITALAAVLATWEWQHALKQGAQVNPNPRLLAPVIRELGGGPVIVFSSFEASFPLVTLPGIGTSSRFPTMTILGVAILDGNERAVRWIQQSFVSDFRRKPPHLLLVETDEEGKPVFDFVGYFAPLVPELAAYRKVRQAGKFQILAAPGG
jgi:hypothetical protein